MNDDDPREVLALLKAEHRRLDEEIERMRAGGQLRPARARAAEEAQAALKDEIQQLADRIIPDIIA